MENMFIQRAMPCGWTAQGNYHGCSNLWYLMDYCSTTRHSTLNEHVLHYRMYILLASHVIHGFHHVPNSRFQQWGHIFSSLIRRHLPKNRRWYQVSLVYNKAKRPRNPETKWFLCLLAIHSNPMRMKCLTLTERHATKDSSVTFYQEE